MYYLILCTGAIQWIIQYLDLLTLHTETHPELPCCERVPVSSQYLTLSSGILQAATSNMLTICIFGVAQYLPISGISC